MTASIQPPVMWSIAGTDSAGGAGLAADQRAADAFGVHLCPVVSAVTAQHSRAVERVDPLPPDLLEAQLAALAGDLPPRVVKTGLLGGATQVQAVARWIDRLREAAPVALVVDPVLGASTGRRFADADTVAAYREWLLPRATLITPNQTEAARLLGPASAALDVPAQAVALQALGAKAVAITGGDAGDLGGAVQDWIATPQARGWLAARRIDTAHTHGTGCTFASSAAAALASGFVTADALVLARMATLRALQQARPAGQGAGPVCAAAGFGTDPAMLPWLSWDEQPVVLPLVLPDAAPGQGGRPGPDAASDPSALGALGLYAIVDNLPLLHRVLAAGVRTLQLRIKAERITPALDAAVREAVLACRRAGATLFVNDHWQLAREHRAPAVHLGQEDLLALGAQGRAELLASGLSLGISSHSLWELCRARTLRPRYVACGPVWPTLTKAMPWHPQGLDNLAWWCAMAGVPVVAIGGILSAEQVAQAARCGADGVCAVRVLGDDPAAVVPALQAALNEGHGLAQALGGQPVPALPHPSLTGP